jgi:hypothetical protein
MALVCPACGTENRSVAKFCIECIAALPTEFEATRLVMPAPEPQEGMPSALAAFAAGTGPSTPMTAAWDLPQAAPLPAPSPRKSIWIALAASGMLLMGAVGWFAAGGTLRPAVPEVPEMPEMPAPTIAAPAPAEPIVPVAAAEPLSPPAESPKPAHREGGAERLFAKCEGLGFLAASRCKVDQCTRSANRQRAECRPVLAQLRLMEEKRNPNLAN